MHTLPSKLRVTLISIAIASLPFKSFALNQQGIKEIIHPFHEGLAAVYLDHKWGYVDKAGKMIIAPQFEEASDFQNGLAAVKIGKEAYYIDRAGKNALAKSFKEAEGFNGNSAIVTLSSGKFALINTNGEVISEPREDSSMVQQYV